MSTQFGRMTEGLLAELWQEETNLVEAEQRLDEARVRSSVASRKYAAVRDMVTEHLEQSPYTKDFNWPPALINIPKQPAFGKHRFVHMKPGDAAVAALKEVDDPLALEEIVERVRIGGLRFPSTMLNRMVNAALMKTGGIEKTEDGKYIHKEEEETEEE